MYGEKAAAMVQRLEQAGNTEVENKAPIGIRRCGRDGLVGQFVIDRHIASPLATLYLDSFGLRLLFRRVDGDFHKWKGFLATECLHLS